MNDIDEYVDSKLTETEEKITILSEALRDLFNEVGEIPQVREAFDKVYDIVKDYA